MWLIDSLTAEQITYGAYDVIYLYDLMDMIVCSIRPGEETLLDHNSARRILPSVDLDPISLVNRLYRFHMLNRLGILTISADCKKLSDESYCNNQNSSKTKMKSIIDIDEKIMEIFLTTINYKYEGTTHKIDIVIEDILSLDTIRKSILNCLRIYHPDIIKIIDPSKLNRIDKFWTDSEQFNSMKGKESIQGLINIIKMKSTKDVISSTNCDEDDGTTQQK